jgi:hypothetical protein
MKPMAEKYKTRCCILIMKHKAPEECSQETEQERAARFEAMRRNIRDFLKAVGK